MRLMFTALVVLALGWSIYWAIGSGAGQKGLETWFEAREAEGWVAEYSDMSVEGFPNRFDAKFEDLALADPDTGLAWEAPHFEILALSYQPNHLIAVWPDSQRIATPLAKYDVTSDDMRASLRVAPQSDLTLNELTLTAKTLTVAELGQTETARLDSLTLAAEKAPSGDLPRYRLGVQADGFTPSDAWQKHLDPNGRLPEKLDQMRIDMTVEFDKPWNISAIEEARPQPRMIDLKSAEAQWGQLALAMAGKVTVDEQGQPEGDITIKARNWRDILQLAREAEALPPSLADTAESALSLLAQMSGNPTTLDIPLTLRGGRVWLGPAPLGPAPVLRLR